MHWLRFAEPASEEVIHYREMEILLGRRVLNTVWWVVFVNDCAFAVDSFKATQWLSDWRSGLGFSAMWLVNNVIEEGSESFPDDETRMNGLGRIYGGQVSLSVQLGWEPRYGALIIWKGLYLWYLNSSQMPTGLFQSQIYAKTFALHLSKFATDDSAWVPGLSYETDDHEPWEAMALTAAAVCSCFSYSFYDSFMMTLSLNECFVSGGTVTFQLTSSSGLPQQEVKLLLSCRRLVPKEFRRLITQTSQSYDGLRVPRSSSRRLKPGLS